MPTSFEVIFLGNVGNFDPTEGSANSENAGNQTGVTFGSTANPLHENVKSLSPGSTGFGGGAASAYDSDNNSSNDTFRLDGGPDQTYDGLGVWNATLTYIDGTTDTITAVCFADTNGNFYLAPEFSANDDATKLVAKPLLSLGLDSLVTSDSNLTGDRHLSEFYRVVTGNGSSEQIDSSYSDAQGDGVTTGADYVYAGGGNDTIDARGGDDSIYGEGGDDEIIIEDVGGAKTIEGGTGSDSLSFVNSNTTTGASVTFTGTESGTFSFGGGTSGSFTSVEGVTGTQYNDTLNASSFSTAVDFEGGGGNDSLVGGSAADTLTGASGSDTLIGNAGNDIFAGAGGGDSMLGGDGDDRFNIFDGFGSDTIDGGTGNDTLDASSVTNALSVTYSGDGAGSLSDGSSTAGFTGIENLWLSESGDTVDASADTAGVSILGNGGDDSLLGGSGQDTIFGGTGADTITGGDDHDSLLGEDGDDILSGGAGRDTMLGGAGNDSLSAGGWADQLDGGDGNDTLLGEGGSDSLLGGDGNDRLDGGASADTLTGGAGNDTFVLSFGDDIITDFNAGNTGTLTDGDPTNNDFIDYSQYFDNLSELYADYADDGVFNQSNSTDLKGRSVDYSDNLAVGTRLLTIQGASADASSFTVENTGVVCFASGTPIRTVEGDIAVEDLEVGMQVLTVDHGVRPIRWIGSREISGRGKHAPIRFATGVLNNYAPLALSPQHRVLISSRIAGRVSGSDQVLVAAKRLVGARGVSIVPCDRVRYFHILFDCHELIYSAGAVTESFYLADNSMRMAGQDAATEILEIFGEDGLSAWQTARPEPPGRYQREIVARHLKNDRPYV